MCQQHGVTTPATVVDHIDPHKGDLVAFWLGPVQSLCKQCHDSPKRYVEQRGYSNAIGADGWPVDPKHPVHTGKV